MCDEKKYLNFPIQLLQDAFNDIHKTMDNIMFYAGYRHTLKLNFGENEEKMNKAGDYFDIAWGNTIMAYHNGESLFRKVKVNSPYTGINKDVCFDFYKNPKSNDEIAVLLAYLGLKSIIGTKPYIKATNDYLISRMGGFVSLKDVSGKLPEPLASYNTRRKLDRIKFELQLNWGVNIYAKYTRGFYVSFENTFPLDKLVLEAEKKRKKTAEAQLKQRINEAEEKALKILKVA